MGVDLCFWLCEPVFIHVCCSVHVVMKMLEQTWVLVC